MHSFFLNNTTKTLHHFCTIVLCIAALATTGCFVARPSAKYKFDDGVYHIKRFSPEKVYVLKIDDDTLAVFPVIEFDDSTAILVKQRMNYTSFQKKFKDNKFNHTFFKPSLDIDLMTITMKYRPSTETLPNQLTTNFNGAVYAGYRIDQYTLNYKRTPLNVYKQRVKHTGYSGGIFAGIGNTLIDESTLTRPNFYLQYEGVLLIAGVSVNMAIENLTLGISFGADRLMDKYHEDWIYENKPYLGFTVGLNIN